MRARRLGILLRGGREAARGGGALAAVALLRDLRPFVRLHFLVAAQRLGLLAALAERPAPVPELVERLGVERPDLLEMLLGVGVEVGALRRRGGAYGLRGRSAAALARPTGDALSALLDELVLYHGRVYRDLPELVRGRPAPDYLADAGTIVARSSRVTEPFIAEWVRESLRGRPAPSLLDVGCGSGVYLRVAAESSPRATGAGIELRPDVAELARGNLAQWGIAERFQVLQGDARAVLGTLGRRFDVALAANNLYYFTPRERVDLFAQLRGALAPGGTLLVVSLFEGTGLATRDLELVLAATPGCYELPALDAVLGELRAAGFDAPTVSRLVPRESLHVVVARPAPAAAGSE